MNHLFNRLRVVFLGLSCSVLLMAPAMAVPVTIDFEGQVASGTQGACPVTTYAEDGFTLTSAQGGICNNYISNNQAGNNSYGNATSVLAMCAGCGSPSTRLTLTNGSIFSLTSIDFGSYLGNNPSAIDVIGFFAGGGSILSTIDPTQSWATYSFTGFSGLSSLAVQLGTSNQHASMDNIVLNGNTVPEPSTVALLGLALVGLGLSRRKAKSA